MQSTLTYIFYILHSIMENEANEQQLLTLDIIQVYMKVLFLPGKSIQFGLALHTFIYVYDILVPRTINFPFTSQKHRLNILFTYIVAQNAKWTVWKYSIQIIEIDVGICAKLHLLQISLRLNWFRTNEVRSQHAPCTMHFNIVENRCTICTLPTHFSAKIYEHKKDCSFFKHNKN